ncbi:MAG: hypothetical protein Q9187_007894 [Circinaria calcarea]
MYGDFDFELTQFALSSGLFTRFFYLREVKSEWRIHPGIFSMLRILYMCTWYRKSALKPLPVLESTHYFEISNLKDKIFAILGLLDATDEAFKPDYSLPVDQVYQDFAAHIVHTGDGINMLSFAGLQYRASVQNIASWVPDWSATRTAPNAMMILRNLPFQAGGSSESYTDVMGDNQNGRTMVVQGSLVDAITSLSSSCGVFDPNDTDSLKLFLEWNESVRYMFQEAASAQTLRYDSCIDAFCRSLLAGNLEGYPIDDQRHEMITYPVRGNKDAIASVEAVLNEDAIASVKAGLVMNSTEAVIYLARMNGACTARRFSITEKGFMGLVPNCAEVGDRIFIPVGSKVPLVLRAKNDNTFLLVGETYIHGIMDGEALKFPDFCPEKIVLI